MNPFLPTTEKEREEILKEIGVQSFEELLSEIPPDLRCKEPLKIPNPISELELRELLESLSKKNVTDKILFTGGGAYDHYIPSAIEAIVSRSEYLTAYTPYQAEVSQGTLQAMYEYQSLICRLTQMEVSNASMYDGASALAEAILMGLRIKKGRKEVLYPSNLNPFYKEVIKTYLMGQDIILEEIPYNEEDGRVRLDLLEEKLSEETVCYVMQHPNFFGGLEDPFKIREITERKGILLISFFNPISLGIISPPGEYGADIAVAEGQPLGIPLSFGGPYLGIMATRKEFLREMPGRIAGRTTDRNGKTGFVMTLQTREQHIRRERAKSNICTNQNLCALRALIYLSLLGREGLREVALQNLLKSHYLEQALTKIGGVKRRFNSPFFNVFVVELPTNTLPFVRKMKEKGILPGIPLSKFGLEKNLLLVAVTEKRKKEELDLYIESTKEILANGKGN